MKRVGVGVALALLAGCSVTQQAQFVADARVAGQLFCAVNTATGPIIVGLITAAAPAINGPAAPTVILATNASKAFVDAACKAAGGIAVSPPIAAPVVPQVAIIPPETGG